MRVPFRQGIVRCLDSGFLTVGAQYVTLNVLDTPTVITLAHGSVDYMFVEQRSAVNAWGPITAGVDQWLYWDLNTQTAQRTFGITMVRPVHQSTPPISPVNDQHWFDTATGTMKVWNSIANRWVERIRVFACELNDGAVPLSMSANSPDFKGTQVGISRACLAGTILFDVATGKPLRTSDNKFLTGETKLQAITGATSNLKTEAILLEAEAQENMPAYTVVEFVSLGRVRAANQFTTDSHKQFGIIETDARIGDIVVVTTTGVISNPAWEWTSVNMLLYTNNHGQLVTAPIGNGKPVGTVIDTNKILLFAVAGGGSSGTANIGPATTTNLGSIKVSVIPTDPSSPVAVGDNDPRIVNALSRTGGTMTGGLTLADDPTDALHAATKQYVDAGLSTKADTNHDHDADYINISGDSMSGPLVLAADPTQPLQAATKQYVDTIAASSGTVHTKTNNGALPLYIGMPVHSSGVGTVARANANTATTSDLMGLTADLEIQPGQSGRIQTSGILTATTGQWDAITEQVGGLTEGATYYLHVAPSGRLTTTPPSTTGQYVVIVGIAVSPTQMFINIQASILL